MNRDEIAQSLMPALLAQLFAEGCPSRELNIFQLAAARAYLGADALIGRSEMPPMGQPGPMSQIPIDLAGAFPGHSGAS